MTIGKASSSEARNSAYLSNDVSVTRDSNQFQLLTPVPFVRRHCDSSTDAVHGITPCSELVLSVTADEELRLLEMPLVDESDDRFENTADCLDFAPAGLEPRKKTGRRVWESAPYFVSWLRDNVKLDCVVELGSGCGAVGLACAVLGARSVVLSDLPIMLPLLRANAARFDSHGVQVMPLDWRSEESAKAVLEATCDSHDQRDLLVVCSDVIYPFGFTGLQGVLTALFSTL